MDNFSAGLYAQAPDCTVLLVIPHFDNRAEKLSRNTSCRANTLERSHPTSCSSVSHSGGKEKRSLNKHSCRSLVKGVL